MFTVTSQFNGPASSSLEEGKMGHSTAHFSFHLSSSGGDFIPRKVRVSAMSEKHEKKKQRFRLLLWAGFELQNRTFSAECIQVSEMC